MLFLPSPLRLSPWPRTVSSPLSVFLTQRCWSSKQWLRRHTNDQYVRLSVLQNYRSRAAFKLMEIQKKYRILKVGDVVIDAGATPGGWSQVASKIVTQVNPNRKGLVMSIDLLDMDPIPGVIFLKGDFSFPKTQSNLFQMLQNELLSRSKSIPSTQHSLSLPEDTKFVDAIISDIAPSFCGNHSIDHLRTNELVYSAFEFAKDVLKPNGNFVCKVLQGAELSQLRATISKQFSNLYYHKPKSSRSASTEGYLVCKGFNFDDGGKYASHTGHGGGV